MKKDKSLNELQITDNTKETPKNAGCIQVQPGAKIGSLRIS